MRFKAKTQTYLNHARSSGPEEAFFLFLLFRFNASVLQIKDPRKTRNIYCIGMKHAQPLVFTRLYILSFRGKGSFNLLSVYMNFFQLNFLLRRRSCIKHKNKLHKFSTTTATIAYGSCKKSKFPPTSIINSVYIDPSFLSHKSPGGLNIFRILMGSAPHTEQRDTKKRKQVRLLL